MITELGFHVAGSSPNTTPDMTVPNTNRPSTTNICQFFGVSSGLDSTAKKYARCLLCPLTFVPIDNSLNEGDNCTSARNSQGCEHLRDSVCQRCSSGYFVDMARTNSICNPLTTDCDNLNFNDVNNKECLSCHPLYGCPCNRFQVESQVMTSGVYPTSVSSNRCVCPIDKCKCVPLS